MNGILLNQTSFTNLKEVDGIIYLGEHNYAIDSNFGCANEKGDLFDQSKTSFIGGTDNATITQSASSAIIASDDSNISNCNYSSIVGGVGNEIIQGNNSSIVNGTNNTMTGSKWSNILGGVDNNITNCSCGIALGGQGLQVTANNQVVLGKYNVPHKSAVLVIGGGSATSRRNILTLSTSGSLALSGGITANYFSGALSDNAVTSALNKISSTDIYTTYSHEKVNALYVQFDADRAEADTGFSSPGSVSMTIYSDYSSEDQKAFDNFFETLILNLTYEGQKMFESLPPLYTQEITVETFYNKAFYIAEDDVVTLYVGTGENGYGYAQFDAPTVQQKEKCSINTYVNIIIQSKDIFNSGDIVRGTKKSDLISRINRIVYALAQNGIYVDDYTE